MGIKSTKIKSGKYAVTIADGNSKLGPKLPNISLPPIKSCGNCEHCKNICYAIKAWKMYKEVRNAWQENMDFAVSDRVDFFSAINLYLSKKQPRFFRWHASGDILDQKYLTGMKWIAQQHPNTKFLVFTKMHHLNFRKLPANLKIVLSIVPGMNRTLKRLPKAWLQDGNETRIPKTAIECPGSCENCMQCWNLDRDVYFHKH